MSRETTIWTVAASARPDFDLTHSNWSSMKRSPLKNSSNTNLSDTYSRNSKCREKRQCKSAQVANSTAEVSSRNKYEEFHRPLAGRPAQVNVVSNPDDIRWKHWWAAEWWRRWKTSSMWRTCREHRRQCRRSVWSRTEWIRESQLHDELDWTDRLTTDSTVRVEDNRTKVSRMSAEEHW